MRRWQLFLGIEFALILWLGFQIITNPMALTTILFGVLFLFLGARWHRMRAFNVTFGGILLVLGIFINPAVWLILMVAGVFLIMVLTKPGMVFQCGTANNTLHRSRRSLGKSGSAHGSFMGQPANHCAELRLGRHQYGRSCWRYHY